MQHSGLKLPGFIFFLLFSMSVAACSPAKPTIDPNLGWGIEVLKFEVKEKLEGVQVVDQYVGTTEEVHQQYPEEGNVYLVMNVLIKKQATGSGPFDWSKLSVKDEDGTAYSRHSNDTFLELFDDTTPRITGLELQIGEHQGWLCFEIPAQAAKGKLTLVYSAEDSQQNIVLK